MHYALWVVHAVATFPGITANDALMELVTKKRLLLFAGSGNPELSEEIAANWRASISFSTVILRSPSRCAKIPRL